MIEEHTGGAVQLGNDHTLSTVDDEGTVVGHQGNLPHVDFLLFNVLDGLVGRFLIVDDEANLHPQGAGISYTAQLTLIDVEYRVTQAYSPRIPERRCRCS